MIDWLAQFIQSSIFKLGFIPSLLIVFVIGMYFFWRDAMKTRKNRNSVFDIYMLTSILMLFWGRAMYVISSAAEYKGLIWFLSPYERYSDGIYYFRLLPWRYFRIWDGGVMYIPMFVSFIVIGFIATTVLKKWRWREVIGSVYLTGSVMFGLTLFISGSLGENTEIYKQGLVLLVISGVYIFVQGFLERAFARFRDKMDKYMFVLSYIFSLVVSFYIYSSLEPATQIDLNHIKALIIFTGISSVMFFLDMSKKNIGIEAVGVSTKQVGTNQPVKMVKKKSKK